MQRDNNYNRIIISLGSNYQQQANINQAKELLNVYFTDIRFTSFIWTDSIGFVSDKFLNGLASAKSPYTMEQTSKILKEIELACGNNESERMKKRVRLDLDLMQFNLNKFHTNDWKRNYIQRLLCELEL